MISRLDKPDPIFWMVARTKAEVDTERALHGRSPGALQAIGYVAVGGSTFFSRMFVDDHNKLQLVDPDLTVEKMKPYCACCTHTLNGVPFVRQYE